MSAGNWYCNCIVKVNHNYTPLCENKLIRKRRYLTIKSGSNRTRWHLKPHTQSLSKASATEPKYIKLTWELRRHRGWQQTDQTGYIDIGRYQMSVRHIRPNTAAEQQTFAGNVNIFLEKSKLTCTHGASEHQDGKSFMDNTFFDVYPLPRTSCSSVTPVL